MTEETKPPEETKPAVDPEILQRQTLATFNSSIIGTFRHMLNIEENKQHVALFAAARAIGELAALAFGKTDQLVEDLTKAMKEHATTIAALPQADRDNKLQQLILRVKEQLAIAGAPAAPGGDPNVGPRLILPKRFKGRTH